MTTIADIPLLVRNSQGTWTLDSLNTKQKMRDQHLRSPDFFQSENHPAVTISVEQLTPDATGRLASQIRLEAAGHSQTINPAIEVIDVQTDTVTLRGEVTVDRTAFGRPGAPLGMAARQACGLITARFTPA